MPQFPTAFVCVDDKAYPALALAPFFQLVGSEGWQVNVSAISGMFSPDQTLTFGSYPGLEVPLDSSGNMRISFRKALEICISSHSGGAAGLVRSQSAGG